jgi:hypothetical protein
MNLLFNKGKYSEQQKLFLLRLFIENKGDVKKCFEQ